MFTMMPTIRCQLPQTPSPPRSNAGEQVLRDAKATGGTTRVRIPEGLGRFNGVATLRDPFSCGLSCEGISTPVIIRRR